MEYRFSKKHLKRNPIERCFVTFLVLCFILVIKYDIFMNLPWLSYPVFFFMCAIALRGTWKKRKADLQKHTVKIADGTIVLSDPPKALEIALSALTHIEVVMKNNIPVRFVGKINREKLFELRDYENMKGIHADLKNKHSCEIKYIKGY